MLILLLFFVSPFLAVPLNLNIILDWCKDALQPQQHNYTNTITHHLLHVVIHQKFQVQPHTVKHINQVFIPPHPIEFDTAAAALCNNQPYTCIGSDAERAMQNNRLKTVIKIIAI